MPVARTAQTAQHQEHVYVDEVEVKFHNYVFRMMYIDVIRTIGVFRGGVCNLYKPEEKNEVRGKFSDTTLQNGVKVVLFDDQPKLLFCVLLECFHPYENNRFLPEEVSLIMIYFDGEY